MSLHRIHLTIDAAPRAFDVDVETPLAEVLQAHEGCGEGVCGACTVLVDGVPVRSCLLLAVQADGAAVKTVASLPLIEGVPADAEGLTPLQQALRRRHAFQCGWCVPGLLVGTASFIADRPDIGRAEILTHLAGHLCRCVAGAGVADAIEDVLAARRAAAP